MWCGVWCVVCGVWCVVCQVSSVDGRRTRWVGEDLVELVRIVYDEDVSFVDKAK